MGSSALVQLLPEACSSMGSPQAASSFTSHSPAAMQHPPWAAAIYQLQQGPPWAAGRQLPNPCLLHGQEGNVCFSTWSTSSLSFSPDLDVCIVVFLTFFFLLSLKASVHHSHPFTLSWVQQ